MYIWVVINGGRFDISKTSTQECPQPTHEFVTEFPQDRWRLLTLQPETSDRIPLSAGVKTDNYQSGSSWMRWMSNRLNSLSQSEYRVSRWPVWMTLCTLHIAIPAGRVLLHLVQRKPALKRVWWPPFCRPWRFSRYLINPRSLFHRGRIWLKVFNTVCENSWLFFLQVFKLIDNQLMRIMSSI